MVSSVGRSSVGPSWSGSGSLGRRRAVLAAVVLALLVSLTALAPTRAGAAPGPPVGRPGATAVTALPVGVALLDVRTEAHLGFDRVIFTFDGAHPWELSTDYVTSFMTDAAGRRFAVPGRSVLQVTFRWAHQAASATPAVTAATAWTLPNVLVTVPSFPAGAAAGAVTYGIGLAQRAGFTYNNTTDPWTTYFDIRADQRSVVRSVYFTDAAKVAANQPHPVTAVLRRVPASMPATGVLDRLYAGPTPAEKARGLSFTGSNSTGFTGLTIGADRVARVRLTGGCGGGSAVVNVADQIRPTLRQFSTVRWVKIIGPDGRTEYPSGRRDSIPECLEP
jgi:hypothetical protein